MIGKDLTPLVTSQLPTIILDNTDISKEDVQSMVDAFFSIVAQKHIQLTLVNGTEFALQIIKVLQERKADSSQNQSDLESLLRSSNIYLEAALLSDDVYEWISPIQLEGQWAESHDFPDIKYTDAASGLRSRLYSRVVDGRKEYIYATAGTVTIKDMTHNFTQLDGTSTQYAQSIENAWVLSSRIAAVGGSLSFTGHSLGGGEAVCNALATGLPAIVFNPAGVADATKLAHGIPLSKDYSNQLITTIVSEKDPLTLFQDAASQSLLLQSAVPAAEGRRYYVHYEDHYLIAHSMTGIADSLRRLTPLR